MTEEINNIRHEMNKFKEEIEEKLDAKGPQRVQQVRAEPPVFRRPPGLQQGPLQQESLQRQDVIDTAFNTLGNMCFNRTVSLNQNVSELDQKVSNKVPTST